MSKSTHTKATAALKTATDGDEVPFATPTLARLYLAQGHHEEARRLALRLKLQGDGDASLDDALEQEDRRRQAVLQALLGRVRANKRQAPPATAGRGLAADGDTSR